MPDTGIENCYQDVLKRSLPARADLENRRRLLLNSDLLVEAGAGVGASVAGLLLFGKNPNRRLPQAGVTAVAFPGLEKEYNTVDEERIRGPLTPRVSEDGDVVERGVIDSRGDIFPLAPNLNAMFELLWTIFLSSIVTSHMPGFPFK